MEEPRPNTQHARGVHHNPANRFENLHLTADPDWYDPEERPASTEFYRDATSSILSKNDSPDIPFNFSINPYRGCEHGCVYCYARPTHEYLGFSSGLDFETRILIKERAPELLRRELLSPRWQPQVITMSGVTDPYQPAERKLQITRRCIEVLLDFRNPLTIITKNALVCRDIDLLQEMARYQTATVLISITTLDPDLRRTMEPRTAGPASRLSTIQQLTAANIPVGILVSPIIPGLNDHEIPQILRAAAEHGARWAKYVPLRLPLSVEPIFVNWLSEHYPDRKEKVLNRLRELRGGKLYNSSFDQRMTGSGPLADQLHQFFDVNARRSGLQPRPPELSTSSFRRPDPNGQMDLFTS
ncbi:MAG: hypothetical protein RI897_1039 [Verrucomicrobiota bacterium]